MKEHQHVAKVVAPLDNIHTMRRWLIDNCGRRWYGTDYRDQIINWRRVGQMTRRQNGVSKIFNRMDRTIFLHFQKRDDMMMFLLIWPGEVVINHEIDQPVEQQDDK